MEAVVSEVVTTEVAGVAVASEVAAVAVAVEAAVVASEAVAVEADIKRKKKLFSFSFVICHFLYDNNNSRCCFFY